MNEVYRDLFDNAAIGLYQAGGDDRLIAVNPCMAQIFGFETTADLLTEGALAAFYVEPDARAQLVQLAVESGEVTGHQSQIYRNDGRVAWISETLRAVRDETGALTGFVGSVEDISARRLMEEISGDIEAKYRRIFENAIEGIWQAAPGGEFISVNAAMASILGFAEPQELITGGLSVTSSFLADEARERFWAALEADGTVRNFECRCRRRDGSVIWISQSARRVTDDRGSVLHLEGTVEDITAFKLAEEELRKLSLAVENSPAGVCITDQHGVIRYVNDQFVATTGYAADEVLGQEVKILKSGLTPAETYADMWRTLGEGRIWRGEFINRKKSGEIYWDKTAIGSITDETGAATFHVAVKEDITELKRTQEALVAAKEAAEAANQAKSEFLAMMSHEVRTPMNGILGMTRLLLDSPLGTEQRNQLETIFYSCEALLTIVNDILDFSKLEAGKMEVEQVPFNLHRLVESVLTLMSSRALEKGLSLELALDPRVPAQVVGDPTRIRQVLLNFLANAIKFTERGGVTVRVEPDGGSAEGAPQWRFAVVDTGIGISEDALGKLFTDYTQADISIARRYGGTGLGLSICRKVVTLMQGRIGVDSRVGQGSRFWFTIPLAAGPGGEERAAVPSMPPLSILVAEDNPVNQKVAAGLLKKAGHAVTIAPDGLQAVEAVKAGSFDVVLMDMQMPGMDGPEAIQAIRALPGAKARIPIIALTASMAKGYAAGTDGYVPKPFDPASLILEIARVIGPRCPDAEPVGDPRVLDPAVLRQLEDNLSPDQVMALLRDFPAIAGAVLDRLRAAAAARDALAVQHAADELRSTSGNFGLNNICTLCETLAAAAAGGHFAEVANLLDALAQHLDAGLRELSRRRPEPAGA